MRKDSAECIPSVTVDPATQAPDKSGKIRCARCKRIAKITWVTKRPTYCPDCTLAVTREQKRQSQKRRTERIADLEAGKVIVSRPLVGRETAMALSEGPGLIAALFRTQQALVDALAGANERYGRLVLTEKHKARGEGFFELAYRELLQVIESMHEPIIDAVQGLADAQSVLALSGRTDTGRRPGIGG